MEDTKRVLSRSPTAKRLFIGFSRLPTNKKNPHFDEKQQQGVALRALIAPWLRENGFPEGLIPQFGMLISEMHKNVYDYVENKGYCLLTLSDGTVTLRVKDFGVSPVFIDRSGGAYASSGSVVNGNRGLGIALITGFAGALLECSPTDDTDSFTISSMRGVSYFFQKRFA